MARDMVFWCDVHLNERDGERVPGDEETITIGMMKPRVLALCPVCVKELLEPLKHALQEYGQVVDKVKMVSPAGPKPSQVKGSNGRAQTTLDDPHAQPNEAGAYPCNYPGCDQESVSYSGLTQHLRNSHGIKWSDYRRLMDGEVTLDDLGLEPAKEDLPNPLPCGIENCQRTFKGLSRKGGRSGHIKRQHPGWTYDIPSVLAQDTK